MRSAFLLAALLASLCLARSAFSAAGLPFLRLSSGARSASLGEATAALLDVDAASVNPAGLSAQGKRSFSLTHEEWIRSIEHDYLALVFETSRGIWGVSLQISQADHIEWRTGPTSEPLGHFDVYEGAAGLSYAYRWNPRLRVGIQVKLIRQVIASRTATGGAVDIGLRYVFRDDLNLGLVVRNLGRMSDLDRTDTPLPRSVRLGLECTALPRMRISTDIRRVRTTGTSFHVGTEYALSRRLVLRGGYQDVDSRGFSAGMGLKAGGWSVDYAFIPFDSGLGEAHRLSVQLHRFR